MKTQIVLYTCNDCKVNTETPYHCTVCEDFDLCLECYGKPFHPHEMKRVNDGPSTSGEKQTSSGELRRTSSIKRCIESLFHACQCLDANCKNVSCSKMKRVVEHAYNNSCEVQNRGNCPICKQLIALSCYHAKSCEFEEKCPIPYCVKYSTQRKLKQQQIQARV